MTQNKIGAAILLAFTLSLALPAGAGQWRDGAQAYQKVCSHCHDVGVGPALMGRNLKADAVSRTVRSGNRAMPSFRAAEIDDATLADVARIISTSAATAQK